MYYGSIPTGGPTGHPPAAVPDGAPIQGMISYNLSMSSKNFEYWKYFGLNSKASKLMQMIRGKTIHGIKIYDGYEDCAADDS